MCQRHHMYVGIIEYVNVCVDVCRHLQKCTLFLLVKFNEKALNSLVCLNDCLYTLNYMYGLLKLF